MMATRVMETDVLVIAVLSRRTTYVIVAQPLLLQCVNCELMVTIQMKI